MLHCEADCFTSDVQQCSVEKPAFSDGGIDEDYRKMPPASKPVTLQLRVLLLGLRNEEETTET